MVQSGRVSYDVRRGLIPALAGTGHHLVGHGKESSDAARGGPELLRIQEQGKRVHGHGQGPEHDREAWGARSVW